MNIEIEIAEEQIDEIIIEDLSTQILYGDDWDVVRHLIVALDYYMGDERFGDWVFDNMGNDMVERYLRELVKKNVDATSTYLYTIRT